MGRDPLSWHFDGKNVSFDGAILDDELWVADGVHLSSMLIDAGTTCGFEFVIDCH